MDPTRGARYGSGRSSVTKRIPFHRPAPAAVALVLALAAPAFPQLDVPPRRDDPSQRYRSARDGATVEQWASRLDDPRPEIRLTAVKSLGESGDPAAARHLVEAALDPDPRVASRAVDYLGRMRATEATDFLAERLFIKGTSDPLRQQILAALGRIGDSRASRPILLFLEQTSDANLRAAAIFALGEIGDSTVSDDVKKLLERETDPGLRKLAGEALAKIEGRRYEPTPPPPGFENPLLRPVEP